MSKPPTFKRIDDGIYSDGTYEIRRVDSTSRSRFVWVLFRDGEPVTEPSKYTGTRIVSGDTLTEAKRLVAKRSV